MSDYLTLPTRSEAEAREQLAANYDRHADEAFRQGCFEAEKYLRQRAARLRLVNQLNQLAGEP